MMDNQAQREREAVVAWLRGEGGVIPALACFAQLVSGNPMPHMSGDDRNRLHAHQRRQFDQTIYRLCDAIERGEHIKGNANGEG
jgi:hypothetical protein